MSHNSSPFNRLKPPRFELRRRSSNSQIGSSKSIREGDPKDTDSKIISLVQHSSLAVMDQMEKLVDRKLKSVLKTHKPTLNLNLNPPNLPFISQFPKRQNISSLDLNSICSESPTKIDIKSPTYKNPIIVLETKTLSQKHIFHYPSRFKSKKDVPKVQSPSVCFKYK
mmetsp:Transcript_18966/g.16800  ORF Transcript_18966/g.16800 Transcript_18966/m.16800 type:complete len:167 (-) Transcript_18966:462-962(-)